MTKFMGHQGDVFFQRLSNEEVKALKPQLQKEPLQPQGGHGNSYTILEGEATGHHHMLQDVNPAAVTVYAAPPTEEGILRRIVETTEEIRLQHYNVLTGQEADHTSITLPPGTYEFRSQISKKRFGDSILPQRVLD